LYAIYLKGNVTTTRPFSRKFYTTSARLSKVEAVYQIWSP